MTVGKATACDPGAGNAEVEGRSGKGWRGTDRRKTPDIFYKNVSHIIKDGKVIFNYDPSTNINNLTNKSFILIKKYKDEILVYYYAIKYQEKISNIDIKNYKVINSFTNTSFKEKDNNNYINFIGYFNGSTYIFLYK